MRQNPIPQSVQFCRKTHFDYTFPCCASRVLVTYHKGGSRTSACDADGEQSLHAACYSGQIELVQWLVQQGAVVDVRSLTGTRPLHCACLEGHLAVAQWLVQQGAAIDSSSSEDGQRPLHQACRRGQMEVVQWLVVQEGVAIDSWSLNFAGGSGHSELAEWLRQQGARDFAGRVPS